jgi:polar amino acid transport system substrate-binding protein
MILSFFLILMGLSAAAYAEVEAYTDQVSDSDGLVDETLLARHEIYLDSNTPTDIILASRERAGATNRDGTGLYWDIIKAVYAPVGVKTKFIIRSGFHSIDMVKNQSADAVVGTFRNDTKGVLFPNYPLAKEIVFVVFKKEKLNQWEGIDSISGKRVAWIRDFHFDRYMDVAAEKCVFETRDHILRLLETDQVDFFVDTQSGLEAALNSKKLDLTNLTAEILMNIDLYLAFADNEKGLKLRAIFNKRFPELVESGEIEKLFVKWNGN